MHSVSYSEEQTHQLAQELVSGYELTKPLVITLEGEMGAGKTQFAKGVAQALGVTSVVVSPTYVLTREYQGTNTRLVHIDCWRAQQITPEELELASYLQPHSVVLIEWPAPLLMYLRGRSDINLVNLTIAVQGEQRIIQHHS